MASVKPDSKSSAIMADMFGSSFTARALGAVSVILLVAALLLLTSAEIVVGAVFLAFGAPLFIWMLSKRARRRF